MPAGGASVTGPPPAVVRAQGKPASPTQTARRRGPARTGRAGEPRPPAAAVSLAEESRRPSPFVASGPPAQMPARPQVGGAARPRLAASASPGGWPAVQRLEQSASAGEPASRERRQRPARAKAPAVPARQVCRPLAAGRQRWAGLAQAMPVPPEARSAESPGRRPESAHLAAVRRAGLPGSAWAPVEASAWPWAAAPEAGPWPEDSPSAGATASALGQRREQGRELQAVRQSAVAEPAVRSAALRPSGLARSAAEPRENPRSPPSVPSPPASPARR